MEKIFKGYVILDWRTGKFSVRKTNPKKDLKPSEIPLQINLKVNIPDTPTMAKIDGTLDITGTKVKSMVLEALEEGVNFTEEEK